jgi:hypothetical protein
MSGNRKLTEGSDTCVASQTSGAPCACADTAQSQWRQERLFEARGILADIAHHPETLVRLACQVICANMRIGGARWTGCERGCWMVVCCGRWK